MKIIYTCTPHPGLRNVGDHAQAVCILRWFHKHWPGVPVLEFDKKAPVSRVANAAEPDDLIFIHSGGNMNDVATMSEGCRRAVIKALPNHRIISLPQTISFSDEGFQAAAEIYNAHLNLTIVARDPMSYSLALKHFGDCDLELCPDFVLGYGYSPARRKRSGVLLCRRHDWESALNADRRREIAKACIGLDVRELDTSVSYHIQPAHRESEMLRVLEEFASARAVITDRLHGVIFSVVAGTPCVVLETVNHKLSASHYWFKDMPQVVFAGGRPFQDALDEALSVWVGRPTMDWHGEWFDPLAGHVNGNEPCFDLAAVIETRRSRRRWLDAPVAAQLLSGLVKAGIAAPSGSNAQCVRFRIVQDKEAIAAICCAKHHHGFDKNHPAAVILIGYDYNVPGTILYRKAAERWLPLAYQDVAAAMQNMLLTAESVGLAACCVSVFDDKMPAFFARLGLCRPDFKWISALFVGWGDRPWLTAAEHQGRKIERKELAHYVL